MKTRQSIAVVGGGVVGLACAAGLAQRNIPVFLITDAVPDLGPEEGYDARSYALSLNSLALLEKIELLPLIARDTDFEALEVWDAESQGRIRFNAADIGVKRLGIVVEHRQLVSALRQRLKQLKVKFVNTSLESATAKDGRGVHLNLDNGQQLDVGLLIGADGFHSSVRDMMNVEWRVRDYHQIAFCCAVHTTTHHQMTGWQCFSKNGIVAFLPLAEKTCTIVWSCPTALASELKLLSTADFLQRAKEEMGNRFEDLSLASRLASFPLRGGQVDRYTTSGMVLIGDAAHSIHPMAGQGANLGFADLNVLLDILDHSRLGYFSDAMLKRYQRAVKGPNHLMKTSLEMLLWLFANGQTENRACVLRRVRAAGLNRVNTMPSIKKIFMKCAGSRTEN